MALEPVTEREMALGKWILEVSNESSRGDDRKNVIYLCNAAMVLAASDDATDVPVNAGELKQFVDRIARGCKARGGNRSEAAIGASYAALATVIAAVRSV